MSEDQAQDLVLGLVGSRGYGFSYAYDRQTLDQFHADNARASTEMHEGLSTLGWILPTAASALDAGLYFAEGHAGEAQYAAFGILVVGFNKARTVARAVVGEVPPSLLKGKANTYVYVGYKDGKAAYVGVTKDITRRQWEHGSKYTIEAITDSPLTRRQARAIEQAMILRNPQFDNIINSISEFRSRYQDAVNWGEAWLQSHGL